MEKKWIISILWPPPVGQGAQRNGHKSYALKERAHVPDEKDQWPNPRRTGASEDHKHSNAPAMRAQGAAAHPILYAKKRNKHAVYVDLPGNHPLRNVPLNLASARTEAGVARVFDFLDRLILAGAEVLGKYEQQQELHLVDVHILVAARQTALKFMDKTVPDVVTKQDPAPTPVQIVINAPLKRLQAPPAGSLPLEAHSSASALSGEGLSKPCETADHIP